MELQTRKRREKDGNDDREGGRRKKTAPQTTISNIGKNVLSDTHATMRSEDEEVEEFYAIVRRMQVAVKYFEKGNNNDHKNTNNAGGDQVRWRAALESTLPAVDADVVNDQVKDSTFNDDDEVQNIVTELIADDVINVVLDLNQTPVEEPETPT